MDSSQNWICYNEHFFVKGIFFVNFELLVVCDTDCQRESLLDSKDLGTNVFRTLMCIVGKP